LRKSVGVPIIVFCHQDDNIALINAMLRNAGIPVHCTRVQRLKELEQAIKKQPPEMLIVFDEEQRSDLQAISKLLGKLKPSPPMLLARNRVSEQSISDAMTQGARDVVSLAHENRFQSVVSRELQAHRMQVALGGVIHSANQYRAELKTLMESSTEAIADVQEGIIVAANPAWVRLFGHKDEKELTAIPFMDLCVEADQPMLKGALVACLREKWDGSAVKVRVVRADNKTATFELNLERVIIEGEAAVRVIIPGNKGRQGTPVELLEQAVQIDPATGFYHRHYFLEQAQERLALPLSGGMRAIVYLRPDDFSRVHDSIGMLGTEKLLTQLADLLKDFMQPADLYGRFGGTMFVAILERGTMNDVEAWAEQIRRAIAEHVFEIDKQSTSITCTIGLCEYENDAPSLSRVIAEVERACRAGRKAGGNRVQMTENTNEIQAVRQEDAEWAPRIKSALANNAFRLVHQPVSSLNEDIDGALDTRVQMLDENGKPILAGEFISAAERMHLIVGIDRWVIDASITYCEEQQPSLIFIRLSADSIADKTLPIWVNTRIAKSRTKPSGICFQVSEEIAVKYLKQVKTLAEELRRTGFQFAVDHISGERDPDRILKHVPMEFVKIDGSLMQGLHRNAEMQDQVKHIVALATERQIKTIAERVEDANTIAILWQLGISFIQGNYVQMQGVVLEDTGTSQGLANV